jgi:hypothetical protein
MSDFILAATLSPVIPLSLIPFIGRIVASVYWLIWFCVFAVIACLSPEPSKIPTLTTRKEKQGELTKE